MHYKNRTQTRPLDLLELRVALYWHVPRPVEMSINMQRWAGMSNHVPLYCMGLPLRNAMSFRAKAAIYPGICPGLLDIPT